MAATHDTDTEPPPWEGLHGSERYAVCLRAARTGNRSALAALVEDLTPLVWHVARGNGLTRATAEDVVQTVWLDLTRSLAALSEPRALADWLITTTRREAQRRRTSEIPIGEHLEDDLLWRAFMGLPERCQELLRLTVIAGRPDYALVAEAMRMPKGNVGPTRRRCLNTLRELLLATEPNTARFPVAIWLSDEAGHEQVEAAIEDLVRITGAEIIDREDPVLGSWFRQMWAKETATAAVHALEARIVQDQDAKNTATMLQHLGPLLTALQPTKDAVIRVGALLIVKIDGTVAVHQLTAAQQLTLDHQPQLLGAPHDILRVLDVDGQPEIGPSQAS